MSVNQIYSINQEKVRKFGQYFGTIDFEVSSTNRSQLNLKQGAVPAGEFKIGNRSFKCTLDDLDSMIESCKLGSFQIQGHNYELSKNELNRVVETCYSAKQVFFAKYRFGLQ